MTRHTTTRAQIACRLASIVLTLASAAQAEDFYAKTRGYRVEPEPDPPSYVRNLSQTQFEQFRDIDWLNVGLDFRTRFEYRENDYRTWTDNSDGRISQRFRPDPDSIWLLRTRAYIGIQDILDPFRFAVEFQDSRAYNSLYATDNGTTNEFELIQGYAELYFRHLLGNNRPLSIRAGRMHLELLDRRLIGNNQFRNTTNNFEGFRVHFGKKQNDWDLDTFALQPVERLKYQFDRPDENTWVYGGVLSIRRWSEFVTIQPYFIGRKQNGDPTNPNAADRVNDRDIYAPGLRVYGLIGKSGFDFDLDINKQFGRYGQTRTVNKKLKQFDLQHDALAYAIELGYTFDHDWKPRVSGFFGYGTGDRDPNGNSTSGVNQRFDSFFGFNQPWSRHDYFSWDNLLSPKARVEFTPYKDVRIDAGYNAYWLESATDSWSKANLRDRDGQSGRFLGHEFDIRLRHKLSSYLDWSLSYARFEPGDFTRKAGKAAGGFTSEPGNFFYFEVSVNAFGDGNPG